MHSRLPYGTRFVFALCTILLISRADASTAMLEDTITIRLGYWAGNADVTFSVSAGQMINYANDESCGNILHTTINQSRYCEHIHISYSLPVTGTDQNGNPQTVTTAKIKDYWDWYYTWYTSDGSEDHTRNCHASAFGKPTWIQDPSYIDADDLQGATNDNDTMYFRQGSGPNSHTLSWEPNEVNRTWEKNMESRTYIATWTFSTPPGTRKKRLYGP